MISINQNYAAGIFNYQTSSSVAFRGKGDNVAKKLIKSAEKLKCSPLGKKVTKEQLGFEHIERAFRKLEIEGMFRIDPARAKEMLIRELNAERAKGSSYAKELLSRIKLKG